jgi:alkylhydroperoxidase/carboxymuconolactone decarboxylase family protein YurZ
MRKPTLLEEVRRKRGYLLSYHRLLHALHPELLAAYDAFYTRFTLDDDVLSPIEKETVWLALIAATRARVGTIHLKRAAKAGMSRDAIADALGLAAACESLDAVCFARDAFPEWVDEPRVLKRYLRAFDAARGRTRPVLAEIAAAVAHAGRRNAGGQRLHLERAFRMGAKPALVAKSLSFVLLHCGGPTMLDAMDVWLKMVKQGKFPSPFGQKDK